MIRTSFLKHEHYSSFHNILIKQVVHGDVLSGKDSLEFVATFRGYGNVLLM